MQRALNAMHFKVGDVDGSFGPKTEDAVRRFQSVYTPYEIDGIVGPKTQLALENEIKRRGL